ncbi:hydroxyacid dehydrogenase [Arthrobacter sp. GMC3]|uniref:hydroxyacid dehydrogenase n=1 Tax=Arthrobacter sp. GMC3 TaxID=2058894 RepID=UPI002157838A|nr:hydroxyacid dehydrogenase [Arthrobacter sp. GMC3]
MSDTSTAMTAAAFAMDAHLPMALFDAESQGRLRARLDMCSSHPINDFASADPAMLAELEVLITGWGAPRIGALELELMPKLRAIFHAAGTVKGHLLPEVWDRGIRVTTSAAVNAWPVAEYTIGMILLAGKGVLPHLPHEETAESLTAHPGNAPVGNYRRTVGIIGASTVGRLVIRLLSEFDFDVLLYDPIISKDDPILALAHQVGLDELFARSSIVSAHVPLLPSTIGMVGERELALLAPGSTFINTARAPIVDQRALIAAVRNRGIRAILDVTDPEPLPESHVLRTLPGVMLTPHVAGALGNEVRRLGESVVREVELFSRGFEAAYPVNKQDLAAMA